MQSTLKRFLFKYYVWLLLIAFIILAVFFIRSPQDREDLHLFLLALGGIASFFYFIQKQQIEELKLFSELYKSFNNRYDELNSDLNRIYNDDEAYISTDDKHLLYDYFNLCSEEYFYYCRGYIYPEVWEAWCNGMWFYLKKEKFQNLWLNEEKNSASYYGLTLEKIKTHIKNSG